MKTAEILRNLLDLLDAEEQQAPQQPVVININNGEVADKTAEPEETIPDNTGVMVPPLQQKIELMKKSQGIDNVYDDAAEDQEELEIIKKNAGLTPLVVIDADEDEPFEG
jgi:hypothetical protein